MGFEDFQPIYGEIKAEWATSNTQTALNPFLFHVCAADASHLKFHVTDFQSSTWEAVLSSLQLDDMRDYIGVGGSWSEFMDYFISSFKSEDLKLILEGHSKSNGSISAKLVGRKSKGMPLVSISLSKLMGSDAGAAMANLSLKIFRAFKEIQTSFVKEQERCCQLTKIISAEKGSNRILLEESLQKYLTELFLLTAGLKLEGLFFSTLMRIDQVEDRHKQVAANCTTVQK